MSNALVEMMFANALYFLIEEWNERGAMRIIPRNIKDFGTLFRILFLDKFENNRN